MLIRLKEAVSNISFKKPKIIFSLSLISGIVVVIIYAVVIYLNYLPLGISSQESLIIGSNSDTLSNFRILPSGNWGNREYETDGRLYRTLNGSAEVIYQPKYSLVGSALKFDLEADSSVSAYASSIDFKPADQSWNYIWDFSEKVPSEFNGNAFVFDKCTYFDGKSILSYPQSKDLFEKGPFSVYAEWMPTQPLDYQEIIGHFNWEVFQSKNSVVFQIGRMKDTNGTFVTIKSPIDSTFFNKSHSILVQYQPDNQNGYIEMFIDNEFVERKYLGTAKVDEEYGENSLTLGWSSHNYQQNPHFKGCLYKVAFANKILITPNSHLEYFSNQADSTFNLVGYGKVFKVSIEAVKDAKR